MLFRHGLRSVWQWTRSRFLRGCRPWSGLCAFPRSTGRSPGLGRGRRYPGHGRGLPARTGQRSAPGRPDRSARRYWTRGVPAAFPSPSGWPRCGRPDRNTSGHWTAGSRSAAWSSPRCRGSRSRPARRSPVSFPNVYGYSAYVGKDSYQLSISHQEAEDYRMFRGQEGRRLCPAYLHSWPSLCT